MLNSFSLYRDFALTPSRAVNAVVLAASTAECIPVPPGAKVVLLNGTADFYAMFGGTAAVPAADVTDGTASALNPTLRWIPDEVGGYLGDFGNGRLCRDSGILGAIMVLFRGVFSGRRRGGWSPMPNFSAPRREVAELPAPNPVWSLVGDAQINEGASAVYAVSYTGAELASGVTATISVATVDGAAEAPDDYTALSTVLTFIGGGVTVQTVAVSTIDDTVYEGTEDFYVQISDQSVGTISGLGLFNTAIIDDEEEPPAPLILVGTSHSTTVSVPLPEEGCLVGDVALWFNEGDGDDFGTSDATPADWIDGPEAGAGFRRDKIMAGLLKADDISAESLSNLSNAQMRNALVVLRKPGGVSGILFVGSQQVNTSGNPGSQTILAATSGEAPLVAFAGMRSSGTVDPRIWAGSTPTEVTPAANFYFLFDVMENSDDLADVTADMNDNGSGNVLMSGWLEVF